MARPTSHSVLRNPLNEIFSAEAHVRILRELCLHGGLMTPRNIVVRTGLSKSGLRKALVSLVALEMIIREGADRTNLYRFNSSHPFAEPISALFKAERDRTQSIFEAIKDSAAATSAQLAALWVYGSVARREDGVESDIDIGLIASCENLALVVEAVRENLREPARNLVFLPNVVGLDCEDVIRLATDLDPWWVSSVSDAIVLAGSHPRELATDLVRSTQGRASKEQTR